MNPNVHTWADGYGRWHARVSRNAAAPLIAARGAIQNEHLIRYGDRARELRHFWMHLEHRPDYDDGDTIVYAEPMTDPGECPRCDHGEK